MESSRALVGLVIVAGATGCTSTAPDAAPGSGGTGNTSGFTAGGEGAGKGGLATGGANAGSAGVSGSSSGQGGTLGGGGALGSGGAFVSGGRGGDSNGGGGAGGDGTGGGGGPAGPPCPPPTAFKWTSSGPLTEPKSGWVSLKDFTHVVRDGKHIVYMTTHDTGSTWGSAMFTFGDWPDAMTATQTALSRTAVAPTLFYFTPKQLWVLAYQWGGPAFSYATSSDPSDPSKWSAGSTLYDGGPTSSTGPIDQTLICDSKNCYLFFATDDGKIHRSEMAIDSFPGTFSGFKTIMTDTQNNLFEAVQVYSVKGAQQYLMLVEAVGSGGRFFRSFTANDLSGDWTPLLASESSPFAGKANVTFDGGTAWTNDISHGDLVRSDPTETMPVDACKLQFLYQGRSPTSSGDYGLLPYRPGLLTLSVSP